MLSEAYVQCLVAGPFPDRLDPWAEVGRYFHQIHSGIIHQLVSQIHPTLIRLGYSIGTETSLQVMQGREPDLFVYRPEPSPAITLWDYSAAAATVEAAVGIAIDEAVPELEAIAIHEGQTGALVTVVEVISPRNKSSEGMIEAYRERREILLRQGVNVVELDLTRSVQRLIFSPIVDEYPYHIVVFLPEQAPRFIGIGWDESIQRCALPLRGEVLPMEVHPAYRESYVLKTIAIQIRNEKRYTTADLPFPTTLSPKHHAEIMAKVAAWEARLQALLSESADEA